MSAIITNPPKTIELTVTAEDLANAGPYMDSHNCLMATMLKRKGFTGICVGGDGNATIGLVPHKHPGFQYTTAPEFSSRTVEEDDFPAYRADLVGRTFTLTLQPEE